MSAKISSNAIVDRNGHLHGGIIPDRRVPTAILELLLTLVALLVAEREASAQALYSWINPSGGNYGAAVNWFPGAGAPPDMPGDGAEFGLSSTYTVDFFSNYTVGDAYVAAGDVTWFFHPLVGETLTYNAFGNVEVSGSSTKLTFGGGVVAANLLLISRGGDVVVQGADQNHAANINVTGAGSSLTHDNFLEIGKEIQGATMGRDETMTIQNGGTVTTGKGSIGADSIFGSAGTVTVAGAGSIWTTTSNLDVGDFSTGTLNISDGGAVSTASQGNIGVDANGTVNVTGAGSVWMMGGRLSLGFNQGVTGTLNITAGGAVSSTRGSLGSSGGSGIATVGGTGSTWINSADLIIGDVGPSGILTIEAGGAVSSTYGFIGNAGEFFDFPASDGTVTVTGTGSTWTNSGDLTVGFEGIGTLNIENGGAVSNNVGYVAYALDSEGDVTVTGAGSTWTTNGILHIGRQGDGTLTIADSGDVTSGVGQVGGSNFAEPDTGTGVVTVSGAGSTWTSNSNVHIGYLNTGTMTIEAGGSVSNINGFLATFVGSTGTATVTGAGSTWTNSDSLNIGSSGNGTLTVENGGAVTNTDGHVGPSPGSMGTAVVRGAGSTWNMTGDLFLGSQGTGTLTIENGGSVSNNSGNLAMAGAAPFGNATATVTGAGSIWTNGGELRIGHNGNGTLNILNGGQVVNAAAYIANTNGANGTVVVDGDGATWTVTGQLSVGRQLTGSGSSGILNINPGGTVNITQTTLIFPSGVVRLQGGTLSTNAIHFTGDGQLAFGAFEWTSGTLHVGTYGGHLANPGGTLAPGLSAGSTSILGHYSQGSTATLAIEIGGTASGTQHDFVNVLGIAALGGNLQLAMLNGFVPSVANTFTILLASGDISGAFANVSNGQRLATSGALGSFVVHYGPGSPFNIKSIVLSDFALSSPGDVNFDGVVDIFDINLVSVHWGTSGPTADANGDGTINIFDINLISANWTQGSNTGARAGDDHVVGGRRFAFELAAPIIGTSLSGNPRKSILPALKSS